MTQCAEDEHGQLLNSLAQKVQKVVFIGFIFGLKRAILENEHGNLFMCRFAYGIVHLERIVSRTRSYLPAEVRTTCGNGLVLYDIVLIDLAPEGDLHHALQHSECSRWIK